MAPFAAAAGMAATAGSTYLQVQSARNEGKSQENIAKYNAQIAERQAKEQQESANTQAQQFLKQRQRAAATNRVNIAKSGVSLEGSPLLALEENASNTAIDTLMIQREGALARDRSLQQANLSRLQGRNAKRASKNKQTAALLSGVSKFSGQAGSSPWAN